MISVRVTNIRREAKSNTIFSGVAVQPKHKGREIYILNAAAHLIPTTIRVGQCWQIEGRGSSHSCIRNGYPVLEHKVQVHRMSLTLPHGGEALVHFLASTADFQGIGDVTARQLWQHFGERLYPTLASADLEALTAVISLTKAESLLDGWRKYENLTFLPWFEQHEIPVKIAEKIIKQHSADAVRQVQKNPYCLLSFGAPFEMIDQLAQQKLGVGKTDSRRLAAAVEEALYKYTKYGHTAADYSDLHPLICRLLGSDKLACGAMRQAHQALGYIITRGGMYQSTGDYVMEQVIARRILRLREQQETWQKLHASAFSETLDAMPFLLNEQQRQAVQRALINAISIVTGGAGTGKTTVLKAIMNALTHLGYYVHGIALAGRAAMRMQELTGYPCRTIASFVMSPKLSQEMDNVVIIDESSMLDLSSMYRIVTSIPDTTHLVLVGDADQLMPIGAGRIFKDLIDSVLLPTTCLKLVNRHNASSGIAQYSQAVRRGIVPDSLSMAAVDFHEVRQQDINDMVLRIYLQSPGDTQVVGATYKSEDGGIDALNLYIQSIVNPEGEPLVNTTLKQGDPVIFTKNDWGNNVQNGTLGRLTSVQEQGNFVGTVLTTSGDIVLITKQQLESLSLAYVISLHKGQGSQFKRVVIVLTGHYMVDRSWLYTAITRAETKVDIVGEETQLVKAIYSFHLGKRKTGLLDAFSALGFE